MGFDGAGSLTKTKAIRVHRAARRALEAAGKTDGLLDDALWESYIARAANVGSRTQAHNFNWRLEKLGLLASGPGGSGVVVLPNDYSGINLDD